MLPPEVLADLGRRLERTAFGASATALAAGPARARPGEIAALSRLVAGRLRAAGVLLGLPVRLRAAWLIATAVFPLAGRGLRGIAHGDLVYRKGIGTPGAWPMVVADAGRTLGIGRLLRGR